MLDFGLENKSCKRKCTTWFKNRRAVKHATLILQASPSIDESESVGKEGNQTTIDVQVSGIDVSIYVEVSFQIANTSSSFSMLF